MSSGMVRLRRGLESFFIRLLELAEKPPACAVTREVIEAGVPRDGLQPAGGRRARADRGEALECFQEHRLRHVFGFRWVAEQPDGRGEHHVLIPPHEGLELVGVGHGWDASTGVTIERTPGPDESFSRRLGMRELWIKSGGWQDDLVKPLEDANLLYEVWGANQPQPA